MKKLRSTRLVVFLLFPLFSVCPAAAAQFDVVVYGGTSAGVVAAVAAARHEHQVCLIEPTEHLGGMSSSGLGFTDTGETRLIGGIARQFYQQVKRHYDDASAWHIERPEQYARYRPAEDAMWVFEPHVAEAIFDRMAAHPNITLYRNSRLQRPDGVETESLTIRTIRLTSGAEIAGKVFIDATYEGDLMAAAGVPFTIGRESNATYKETLNGVQKTKNIHNHRFRFPVDPYVIPGQPDSGLVPEVDADDPGQEGQGDRRLQAYCFRMCMTKIPSNRVPFPKPDNYDESIYELLFRNFEAGDLRVPMHAVMIPNGKTDTNNNGAFSTDYIGKNYQWPEASYEQRERLLSEHRDYQQGLMWTLVNHPRTPLPVRKQMAEWGLAKDEFQQNGHWPYQLYIREARRMVSDYVVTEHDCFGRRLVSDSVGMGSYNLDSHNVQRYVTADGNVQNEGDVQVSPGGPYLIGYRSIVPPRGSVKNLFVPVCLSASHIAYGSVRMEPVFMILGHSAGSAAAIAIEDACAVQDVPYAKLRKRLIAESQRLDLPGLSGKKVPSTAVK